MLTRRNTFDPLHDKVDSRGWIGPISFITEADEFSKECVFPESVG